MTTIEKIAIKALTEIANGNKCAPSMSLPGSQARQVAQEALAAAERAAIQPAEAVAYIVDYADIGEGTGRSCFYEVGAKHHMESAVSYSQNVRNRPCTVTPLYRIPQQAKAESCDEKELATAAAPEGDSPAAADAGGLAGVGSFLKTEQGKRAAEIVKRDFDGMKKAIAARPTAADSGGQKPYQVTIDQGFFAGCKVTVDPSLPADTVEMRGANTVRLNVKTGEITEIATPRPTAMGAGDLSDCRQATAPEGDSEAGELLKAADSGGLLKAHKEAITALTNIMCDSMPDGLEDPAEYAHEVLDCISTLYGAASASIGDDAEFHRILQYMLDDPSEHTVYLDSFIAHIDARSPVAAAHCATCERNVTGPCNSVDCSTPDTPTASTPPAHFDANDICQVPPEGWYCTRKAGHDGPCAALQHEPDRELDADDHACISEGMARIRANTPPAPAQAAQVGAGTDEAYKEAARQERIGEAVMHWQLKWPKQLSNVMFFNGARITKAEFVACAKRAEKGGGHA